MNTKKNPNQTEYASIGLSVIGAVAAVVTQQIAYIATPLTLSLSLSLINRQRDLVKADRRLANLEQQLTSDLKSVIEQSKTLRDSLDDLPPAPTTSDFHQLSESVRLDRAELDRLGSVLIKIEKKGDDLSPFLTEIDLTKDSLQRLSLNFSNFEKEFNSRQDSTRVTSAERVMDANNIYTIYAPDAVSQSTLKNQSLQPIAIDSDRNVLYLSIEQIKLKLQFLEENSKISEESLKKIGWHFLNLEKEFNHRQDLIDIINLKKSLLEIESDVQSIALELSNTKTDHILKIAGLELDRSSIYSSLAETKSKIQFFEDNLGVSDLVDRIDELDTSLGALHDYNLGLNNRIDNYQQYEIAEIIDALVSAKQLDTLIQQEVNRSSLEQLDLIKQILPKKYNYNLVYGREESRQVFLDALPQSQERLILVCPWLTNYAIDPDVRDLIINALERGVSIDIGWGHLKDVNNDRSRLSKAELLKPGKQKWLYNAIPLLDKLQAEYPNLLNLKVLGTHEKFLVCDRKFAMLGSHNYLTSHTHSSERELGLKTDSPELIDKLIELFDR
ncbi:phospholipase D-like domain-containing protein [Chamaesiphon sp.]|uniref:phospholipase D-like domain-containing protein n=1 Tax=Chamaesiphon sp. TaxID=2814140 RepID=UPI00359348F7